MFKDGSFVIDDVTSDNIGKISEKQSKLAEQRICEISELSYEVVEYATDMIENGYGIYEVLSVLGDALTASLSENHSDCMPGNTERLISYFSMVDAYDKAVLSEFFVERMKAGGFELFESHFLPEFFGDETFTYVKNSLADEAYDVFSQQFSNPTVKYSATFKDAVRAVIEGEFEYCLLPLEEHGGVRLSSVAELIFKNDLKIGSVTPVFGFDGLADMKYALVSKHFNIPKIKADDDRYLEIRLGVDSSMPLSDLLSAARALGIALYRVNTIVFEGDDGPLPHYSVVFRSDGRDFSSLLVFLTLFSGAYTSVGIYNNLE